MIVGSFWTAAACAPSTDSGGGQSGGDSLGGQTAAGGSGADPSGGSGGTATGGAGGSGTVSPGGNGGGSGSGRAVAGGGSSDGSSGSGGTGTGGVGTSAGGSDAGSGGTSAGGRNAGGAGGSATGGRGGRGGSSTGGAGGAPAGGNSGTTTGGNGGATSTGNGPTISGLKIEANPKNVLSAFASWTTDQPSDSVVQFGEGSYQWEISDAAQVTSHKVLIIGMHASKAYQIKAMSSTGSGTSSATDSFTAGALPSQIPVADVTVNDTAKSQPGWTLMNIIKSSSSNAPVSNDPSAAVMYDATGQPVWYYINGSTADFGGAISTYLTDKGVLIGPVMSSNGTGESPREVDFAGNTVWECTDPRCGGTGDLTHDTIKLSNGNHVILRWKELGTGGPNMDSAPVYEEIDAGGKVVWSLDYGSLVPKPSDASGDWCHGNSITVDIANDVVYANCRFMGLIKTRYSNPNSLVWHMAAKYGEVPGTVTFSSEADQYEDVHDPEIHDDGTILFFDNGGYSMSMMPGQPTTTYHSRAVEYQVDENAKTATLVWEFPGSFNVDAWYKNDWYDSYFGDADRLANGNVLIAAGSVKAMAGGARVFEVTKADGQVVWEFRLPASYGVYRAERIPPPLVKALQ
ncbi:MAG: aryl-sulfate sulfotransferase [Polyangiaceae bacterium]|nr:aryl-sulfate sulfotransferase [Polyangiaceae bacterium]